MFSGAIEVERWLKMGLLCSSKTCIDSPNENKRLFIVAYQNSFTEKMNKIHT